ncbi:MAG: flagellar basal-body rod protein FlgF [Alphaproteobacteria bacterium]|nr:flagellar basal-body rod protein FlgF [Alphaproteobacteria bacterium]
MDNTIYIALSKQAGQFRQMDVIANNIANADTAGFSAEKMIFNQYLVKDGDKSKMAFAQDIATFRDTTEGKFKKTDGTFDVAIRGDGYFRVQTPLGVRYTRAGNFQLDGEGTMVTPDGFPVLSQDGEPVQFAPGEHNVSIGRDGTISVNNDIRSRLGIVRFDNPQLLEHTSSGLYRAEIEGEPVENAEFVQGFVESSNVQPVIELTGMIKTSRSVGNTAKLIEVMFDLQRRTVRTENASQG